MAKNIWYLQRVLVFMHDKLRVHKTITVSTNLHRLIYDVFIDIAFPIHFVIS